MADDRDYDAFISYSTRADYHLVRSLEGFLESFHKLKTPGEQQLRPLSICVDGSDFSISSLQKRLRDAKDADRADAVEQLLAEHLARAKCLVVLCAGREYESRWLEFELAWWLEHRDDASVYIAVTHGEDPSVAPAEFFPPKVIAAGLHQRVWFDLRGHTRDGRRRPQVRDFDEERMRLAAELYGTTLQEIQPIWFREERRRTRAWLSAAGIASAVFLGLAGLAWNQRDRAREAAEEARRSEQQALAEAERAEQQRRIAVARSAETMLDAVGGWIDALPVALATVATSDKSVRSPPAVAGALARAVFAAVPLLEIESDPTARRIAMSGDGGLLVTAGIDGELAIRDGRTGRAIESTHSDDVFRWVETTHTGDAVVTAGRAGLQIWSVGPLANRCVRACDGNMLSAQLSPDERLVLTSCTNRSHQVYEVASCRLVATIGHPSARLAVGGFENEYAVNFPTIATFAPDSTRVAVPAAHGFAVWSIAPAREIARIGSDGPRVQAAIFARSANRVLTMLEDNRAAVWDLSRPDKPIRSIDANTAAISADGRHVIYQGRRSIHILDVDSGALSPPLTGEDLEASAFAADNERALGLGTDGIVRMWDVSDGHPIVELKGHSTQIDDAVFASGGSTIATTGRDGVIRLWDVSSRIPDDDAEIRTIEFSMDGARLVTGEWDGHAQLRDGKSGAIVAELPAHANEVQEAVFSASGAVLVTTSVDAVHVIDSANGHMIADLPVGDTNVETGDITLDGSRIVTAALQGPPKLWDARRGTELATLPVADVTAARFLADGRIALRRRPLGDNRDPGGVEIWTATGAHRELELVDRESPLEDLALSPDRTRIATIHRKGATRIARLWSLGPAPKSRTIELGPVRADSYDGSLVFSSDGHEVVGFSLDPTATVWHADAGTLTATLRAGAAQIDWAEPFDRGGRVLTHDSDQRAILWDSRTGERIASFDGVTRVRMSPNGVRLAVASGRLLRLFDFSEQALIEQGCRLLTGLRDVPALPAAQVDGLRRACGLPQNAAPVPTSSRAPDVSH